MIDVRVCIPFYWEGDYYAISDVLWTIIWANKLEHEANPQSEAPRWFRYEDIKFYVEPRQTTRIKDGRNTLISDVFDGRIKQYPLEYDYFWMLDTDIVFELHHIVRLIRTNVDVIGCPYCTHQDPGMSNVIDMGEDGNLIRRYPMSEKGAKIVGGLPGGFFIVSRDALLDIGYPWFVEPMVEWDNGKYCQEIGEDMGFCKKAREAGYQIICDFDHPVKHKPRTINWKRRPEMNEKAKAPQAPGPKAVNFTPQDFAVFEQVNPSGWIHLNAIRMERELAEKDAIIKNMAGRLVTNEQEKKAEKAPAEEPPAPEGVEAA